jgi:di/tricarboxylate transporter
MDIVLVTIILLVAVALLISERLPIDLTAIGIMVALMVTGLLTPREAVAGFANPAPLTVGALFVVTRGLTRTGSLNLLTRTIAEQTRGRPRLILLLLLLLTGLLSAFINNTPVVAMLLAVVIALCGRFDLSPGRFLIPISFVSILAGTTTLIGTSTNIIVSDLAAQAGHAPIGMFELTSVGLPIAVAGGLLVFLLTPRLLPETHTPILHHDHGEKHKYISELVIRRDSDLVGQDVVTALTERHDGIEVYEVLRGHQVLFPETDDCTLEAGDVVLLGAAAADLVALIGSGDARLPEIDGESIPDPYHRDTQIVEAIIPPESPLLGRRLDDTFLDAADDINVLGVQRRRLHYAQRQMSRLRLALGDLLLIQCGPRRLQRLRTEGDVIIVEDVVRRMENRRKAPVAVAIFLAMVAAASLGVVDILVAALAAAFLMLLTGCLQPREAYDAIDVPVLVLIIGTIALGAALTRTGAADLYASGFLSVFQGAGPHAVLAAFIVLTSVLSHFLSNNSTAVLLVPVGLAAAAALGVDPRPFVVGICFGASACFATPIGYQTNLLVFGPGGYRFADFFRLGMVLNLLVWVAASVMIPRVWPF